MEFAISAELLTIYLEDARGHLALLDAPSSASSGRASTPRSRPGPWAAPHPQGQQRDDGLRGSRTTSTASRTSSPARRPGPRPRPGRLRPSAAGATALRDAVEGACVEGREGATSPPRSGPRALVESGPARPGAARPAARAARAPPGPAGGRATPPLAPARSTMVRVDFAQLDHLLNLVGELIIYRTKLDELAGGSPRVVPGGEGRELLEAVQQVAGVSTQLQETIMDVRMLPIRHVFERFPRLVRDLARQQGKEVELDPRGRGHPRRQGGHRRDRRAARAPDPQRGGPRHRAARRVRAARGKTADRHHPALGRPGVEPGRDHHHGRRGRHRRGGGAAEGARAGPPPRGRGAHRPRGDPAHLHRGLLDRRARSPTCRGAGWGSTWWCRASSG